MKHHKTKSDPTSKTSGDLLADQTARLKKIFPEAFIEGKVDFEKLRATLGDLVDDSPERYTFNWAGKLDAIRLLQTPTRATLVPCREESVNFDTTQHLFIEGDNLEVLKLLYKPYFGRVKMIYIDPPYNTGNDFVYPDNFADPLGRYLEITGQRDAEGNLLTSNPETSGRYHSAWLSMMYPRLFIARQLLREDGVIFVSIDDHEVHNLRLLMNETFGEENFLAQLVWERADSPKMDAEYFSTNHDYILCYARNLYEFEVNRLAYEGGDIPNHYNKVDQQGRRYYLKPLRAMGGQGETREARPNLFYGIKAPDGTIVFPKLQSGRDGAWRWSKKKFETEKDRIEWTNSLGSWIPYFRIYADDSSGKPPETILYNKDVGSTRTATAELKQIFQQSKFFDTPKPSNLIKHLIKISASVDDIVLDFFAGSATAAQATLELNREDDGNRHFIMVQLPEPTDNPDYPTIAEVGKERIRRAIAKMKQVDEGKMPLDTRETSEDLGFKVFKLATSNFRSWTGVDEDTPEAYTQQMAMFSDPLVDNCKAEDVIYEVALKEGYGLNCAIELLADIAGNTVYRVTDPDKEQSFYICLDNTLEPETLRALNLSKDDLFVCRDVALDDEAAANLALQCRLKSI